MEYSEPSASQPSESSSQSAHKETENADGIERDENADDAEMMDVQDSEVGGEDETNLDDTYDLDEDGGDGVNDDDTGEDRGLNQEDKKGRRKSTKSTPTKAQEQQDVFEEFEFVQHGAEFSSTEEEILPPPDAWVDGDKVCTATIKKQCKFVCVDYPGVIQNQEKAIATLGGMEELSKVLSDNLKMELAFRPQDPFCKPTIASFSPSGNLLIKIKRRRKILEDVAACSSSSTSSSGDGFEYQIEVLGLVHKLYTFDKFCDFQYLPVIKQPDGQVKEILSSICPTMKDSRQEYLARPTPLFLPPFLFSRRENPASYTFDSEVFPEGEDQTNIGLDRKSRNLGAIHMTFDQRGVPKEPDKAALLNMSRLQPQEEKMLEDVKKIFEIRPIWSKAAMLSHLDIRIHHYMRFLLPMVAFYFINGPWRSLWCKFGYDPRKIPEAKLYQTLDYRVRTVANKQKVDSKRGLELFRYSQFGLKQQSSATMVQSSEGSQEADKTDPPIDLTYIFSPEHVPPYRQIRYQVCDVRLEEVQKRMHENDGEEIICTERDGWCVPDFTDECRNDISDAVDKLLTK